MSGYGYAAGNPIKFIDVNGDSLRISYRTGFLGIFGRKVNLNMQEDGYWYDENGDRFNRDNLPKRYDRKTSDIQVLLNDPDGSKVVTDLIKSPIDVELKSGGNYEARIKKNGEGDLIKITISGSGSTSLEGENVEIPSWIALGHELQHAKDRVDGRKLFYPESWGKYTTSELTATYFENQLRTNAGIPLRQYYDYNDPKSRILIPGTSIHLISSGKKPYCVIRSI
jgi:hypothetical protein